ncbi:MAG: hypothetical protein LBJ23_04020 [Tannerella sp.]|jgi:hypothetical protein|nr:hypothetical protein [Tannerella sp.]
MNAANARKPLAQIDGRQFAFLNEAAHGVFGNSKQFGCLCNGNVRAGLDFGNMRGDVFEQGLFSYILFFSFQAFLVWVEI